MNEHEVSQVGGADDFGYAVGVWLSMLSIGRRDGRSKRRTHAGDGGRLHEQSQRLGQRPLESKNFPAREPWSVVDGELPPVPVGAVLRTSRAVRFKLFNTYGPALFRPEALEAQRTSGLGKVHITTRHLSPLGFTSLSQFWPLPSFSVLL